MKELLTAVDIPDCANIAPPDAVVAELVTASNGLNAYVAESAAHVNTAGTPPVAVLYAQWSDSADRIKQQFRAQLIADNIQGIAVAIDNPGVSLASPSMSADIRRTLRNGDFSAVSRQQWDAISELLDARQMDFDDISQMIGYSLGTHIAASAIDQAPRAVQLERVSLLETPGLREYGASPLVAAARLAITFFVYGGQKFSSIIKSNPEWASACRDEDPTLLPRLIAQRPAGLVYYPWAIPHPNNDIAAKLISQKDRALKDATVVIGVTDADRISPLDENRRLVQRLGEAGMKAVGLEMHNSVHASQDNMAWWKGMLEVIDREYGNFQ